MAAGDLATLAGLKAWLGNVGSSSDAQLQTLLTAASAFIKSWTNRDFVQATYTVTKRANRDLMVLDQYPVISVSSVQWQGFTCPAGDPITGTSGYYVDTPNALRLTGYTFPSAPVRVVYSAGYATIPEEITQTCIELAGEAFKRASHIGELSKTLGGQETIHYIHDAANATVLQTLAQYKKTFPGC